LRAIDFAELLADKDQKDGPGQSMPMAVVTMNLFREIRVIPPFFLFSS
jgi:hypothetical protein